MALMTLHELRRARRLNQTQLAKNMSVQQGEVSKIEHRGDLRVSTLDDYVRGLGGRLEIRAVFPEVTVQIDAPGIEEEAPAQSARKMRASPTGVGRPKTAAKRA